MGIRIGAIAYLVLSISICVFTCTSCDPADEPGSVSITYGDVLADPASIQLSITETWDGATSTSTILGLELEFMVDLPEGSREVDCHLEIESTTDTTSASTCLEYEADIPSMRHLRWAGAAPAISTQVSARSGSFLVMLTAVQGVPEVSLYAGGKITRQLSGSFIFP